LKIPYSDGWNILPDHWFEQLLLLLLQVLPFFKFSIHRQYIFTMLSDQVVITDGARQYFRPSIYKMKEQVLYEVPDFQSGLLKDNEDLALLNQSYERLCYIRKRLNELQCKDNENKVDILVLLGIEHKLHEQLGDVEGFITHYKNTLQNIDYQLGKFSFKISRLFSCKLSTNSIAILQNKANQQEKLDKFLKEKKELNTLFQYIQGKIMFLSNDNIIKLGIIKD